MKSIHGRYDRGGDSASYLRDLTYVDVYARVDPETKIEIIKAFQAARRVVLMCGDGSNDIGALNQADAGIALLTGFGLLNAETKEEEQEHSRGRPTREGTERDGNKEKQVMGGVKETKAEKGENSQGGRRSA